jgi:hypothetical protein
MPELEGVLRAYEVLKKMVILKAKQRPRVTGYWTV